MLSARGRAENEKAAPEGTASVSRWALEFFSGKARMGLVTARAEVAPRHPYTRRIQSPYLGSHSTLDHLLSAVEDSVSANVTNTSNKAGFVPNGI